MFPVWILEPRSFWKTRQYSTPEAHGGVCFPNMQSLAASEEPQEVARLSTIVSLGFQGPGYPFPTSPVEERPPIRSDSPI